LWTCTFSKQSSSRCQSLLCGFAGAVYSLNDPTGRYLTALAAFYIRLTASPIGVYTMLESLLEDRRKLRVRDPTGTFTLTHMDAFVDALLTEERVCDTILPRMTKRHVLEENGELEPRISALEDELLAEEEAAAKAEEPSDLTMHKRARLHFKTAAAVTLSQQVALTCVSPAEVEPKSRDGAMSVDASNRLRASLGLPLLKP
jgi:hypothetical protein